MSPRVSGTKALKRQRPPKLGNMMQRLRTRAPSEQYLKYIEDEGIWRRATVS